MTKFYKVPITDGYFAGVDYNDVTQGVGYNRHVEEGFGYFKTEAEYPFEEVTSEKFALELEG